MKIKSVFCALILTATLTACNGNPETPNVPVKTTAETTATPATAPSGTFNEEVFDEVISNIVIDDKTISLPCTIEDLGEDFSYSAEFPYYDKENGVAFYGLLYNENDIGTAVFKYEPDDKDLSDNQILGLSLGTIFMERENCGLYLAGLTLNDTEDAVIDKLGQPTKFNGESGNGIMYYRVFNNDFVDEKYITIDLEDGKVSRFHIQLPINNESAIEPDGTFNEEVFDEIVNNIVIGDKTISLPCTIGDFGEGFEFGKGQYHDKENGILGSEILYKNNIACFCSIKYTDDDSDLTDNELTGISFSKHFFEMQDVKIHISVGDITFDDTIETVQKKFGEPTEKYAYESGDNSFYYKVSENNYINIEFNYNGDVTKIYVINKEK